KCEASKKGTSWVRSRSSPAWLEWPPKLNKGWGFTPIVLPREFLQHSRQNSCPESAKRTSHLHEQVPVPSAVILPKSSWSLRRFSALPQHLNTLFPTILSFAPCNMTSY